MSTASRPLVSRPIAVAGLIGLVVYVAWGIAHRAAPQAPAAPARLTGEELCRRDLTKMVEFRDPASVRIESAVTESNGEVSLVVNAKNGFGGYTGPQSVFCQPDMAGQRVEVMTLGR
jgi:hypothetical protein